MAGQLHIERHGDLALLTLHNPSKRNALDAALLGELRGATARLSESGVRAAVLTGSGSLSFSSGYDIAELPDSPDEEWLRTHGPLGEALSQISAFPMVAALNGPAIGSGCELAITCDLRVAHDQVFFQMPPVRMGLVYTPMGIARLVALCGAGRAREMLLCAQRVPAAQALAIGLLNRVVPQSQVIECAMELASEIARAPLLAVQGTREVMELLLKRHYLLDEGEAERVFEARRQAWLSREAREARAAFLRRKG